MSRTYIYTRTLQYKVVFSPCVAIYVSYMCQYICASIISGCTGYIHRFLCCFFYSDMLQSLSSNDSGDFILFYLGWCPIVLPMHFSQSIPLLPELFISSCYNRYFRNLQFTFATHPACFLFRLLSLKCHISLSLRWKGEIQSIV